MQLLIAFGEANRLSQRAQGTQSKTRFCSINTPFSAGSVRDHDFQLLQFPIGAKRSLNGFWFSLRFGVSARDYVFAFFVTLNLDPETRRSRQLHLTLISIGVVFKMRNFIRNGLVLAFLLIFLSSPVFAEEIKPMDSQNWKIIDIGEIDGPSSWKFEKDLLKQTSNIHSGETYTPDAPGTYVIYKAGGHEVKQFGLTLRPAGDGVMGVLVRYIDTDNHYLVTFNGENNQWQFVRVFKGEIDVLAENTSSPSQKVSLPDQDEATVAWKGAVTANVNLREAPDLDSTAITVLVKGTQLRVVDEKDGWLKVDQIEAYMHHGWVYGKYVRRLDDVASSGVTSASTKQNGSAGGTPASPASAANQLPISLDEHIVRVIAEGSTIKVFNNGEALFNIDDDQIIDGTIGFYSWKDAGCVFAKLEFAGKAPLSKAMIEKVLSKEPKAEPSAETYDSTEALVKILTAKGVLNETEARAFIELHQKKAEASKSVVTLTPEKPESETLTEMSEEMASNVNKEIQKVQENIDVMSEELMRRSRLQEQKHEELDKKVRDDHAGQLFKSSWAQRIKLGGDIRLRYRSDTFPDDNAIFNDPQNPSEIINSTENRKSYQARVRLSAKVNIIDPRDINVGKVDGEIRVSTGKVTNPVSTNETLGDYLNKDTIVLDRYYLRWKYVPWEAIWDNKLPEFAVTGGRMPNPWFYSNLVWDDDLAFEGLVFSMKTDTQDFNPLSAFFTIGAFPIQEEEFAQRDKWLYGGQVGIDHKPLFDLSYKIAFAYYDYENIEGIPNKTGSTLNDYTAPLFQQKGNTLIDIDPTANIKTALASDYDLINLTGKIDYTGFFPIHIIGDFDYVKNIGFDKDGVKRLTGNPNPDEDTTGYRLGMTVGYPKPRNWGEWNASLTYKYLEGDAVLDAFTDSDFHLGGTNARGWILDGEYGLYRNIWLKGTWITSDEIKGSRFAVDTFMFDVKAEF